MQKSLSKVNLRKRYDVSEISEDEWHSQSTKRTRALLHRITAHVSKSVRPWLNAGSGIYRLNLGIRKEISLDLFLGPIQGRKDAVCADLENLPLASSSSDAVICVGEVLAYCDPAKLIAEFRRVLSPCGLLVCDFGNSNSLRHLRTPAYGRAADLITDSYNNSPEIIWIYSLEYIGSLLRFHDFQIKASFGTHTWSALARGIGASTKSALLLQDLLGALALPVKWADVITVAAVKGQAAE